MLIVGAIEERVLINFRYLLSGAPDRNTQDIERICYDIKSGHLCTSLLYLLLTGKNKAG